MTGKTGIPVVSLIALVLNRVCLSGYFRTESRPLLLEKP